MYAGRVVFCPLVSYVEYAPRTLLKLNRQTDRQTDGRQTVILLVPQDAAA